MSIAEEVQRDLGVSGVGIDADVMAFPVADQMGSQYQRQDVPQAAIPSFMGDLIEAQQKMITAQYQYLHDSDLQAFARAQRDLIAAQTEVLTRLKVFG